MIILPKNTGEFMFTTDTFLDALESYIDARDGHKVAVADQTSMFHDRRVDFASKRLENAKEQLTLELDGLIEMRVEEKLKEIGYHHAET